MVVAVFLNLFFAMHSTVSGMIASKALGALLEVFNILPKGSTSSMSSSESESLSSSANCGPQMYSRLGYTVEYSISIGFQVFALLLLLFVNTGRARRNQAAYDEELERRKQTKELLLPGTDDTPKEEQEVTVG